MKTLWSIFIYSRIYIAWYLVKFCDIANFIDRLHAVECSVNWGDPYQLNVGYTVIQICYKNGDFDFIHADAQWFNRSGVNEYGFFFFDDEQLETLISDYLS